MKQNKLPIVTLLLFVLILSGLTGCANNLTGQLVSEQVTKPISKSMDEPLIIGGVFHLSGAGSFWGTSELNGVKLAIEEINSNNGISGRKIKLVVEDGATDFKSTASAFNKLIEVDNLKIILGPTWFGQVASPIAKDKETLMISPSTGVISTPSKYYFTVWPSEEQDAIPILEHLKKTNRTKVAVIYSLNDWSAAVKQAFTENADRYGIKIVGVQSTDPNEKDFRSETKIKYLGVRK